MLHTLNVFVGFLVMLSVMSFSLWIFLAAVAGISVGATVFQPSHFQSQSTQDRVRRDDQRSYGSTQIREQAESPSMNCQNQQEVDDETREQIVSVDVHMSQSIER